MNSVKVLSLTFLVASVDCMVPDGAPWGRHPYGRGESSMGPRHGDMALQNDFYGVPSYGMGGGMGGGFGREEFGMPSFGMAGMGGGMGGGMNEYGRGSFGGRGSPMPMGNMRGYMPGQESGMNGMRMASRSSNGRPMPNGYDRPMPDRYGRSMQGGYGRSQSMMSRGFGRDEYYGGGGGPEYHHAMGGPRDFQDDMRYGRGGMSQDRMGGNYGREGYNRSSRSMFNGPSEEQGFSGSDYRTQQSGRTSNTNRYTQRPMGSNWNN